MHVFNSWHTLPGVHRAPETHFLDPSFRIAVSSDVFNSRAEVGKLQSTRQSQLMACFVHKILLEHRRSLTYHLWLLSCHGAGLSSCHRVSQRVWTASKTFYYLALYRKGLPQSITSYNFTFSPWGSTKPEALHWTSMLGVIRVGFCFSEYALTI